MRTRKSLDVDGFEPSGIRQSIQSLNSPIGFHPPAQIKRSPSRCGDRQPVHLADLIAEQSVFGDDDPGHSAPRRTVEPYRNPVIYPLAAM
jgi:hypothetical protein